MEDFRKEREDGRCRLKTGVSRSKRESWNICNREEENEFERYARYSRQFMVFRSPDKYINSTKTNGPLLTSKFVSCGRAVPLLSAILL